MRQELGSEDNDAAMVIEYHPQPWSNRDPRGRVRESIVPHQCDNEIRPHSRLPTPERCTYVGVRRYRRVLPIVISAVVNVCNGVSPLPKNWYESISF